MSENKSQGELQFEKEVIDYLTKIGGTQQWVYLPKIKTTEELWANFKHILEQHNQARLDAPLSVGEFAQVKKVITNLETPYKAGQFLYGVNGSSQVEVDLDNGKHVYLTVFDQEQIGMGGTVYQIVNQIQRPAIIDGKKDRRFDVTMLINGLPILQIELKKDFHSVTEAFNQMQQYIAERQYGDIFSTLQILVAMTPHNAKYMANTTIENFNQDFTFNWQSEEDSTPVSQWRPFSDQVLSIPMAHNLATRFMILDGTKNKESIKVMRPYQVYATQRVLDKVQHFDFKYDDGRLGYIWHTTGSGKTITSFKTAWLASRLPNVNKVVFLVDRIALTNQTTAAYQAYDPVAGFAGKTGVVGDTANINDLHRKLTKHSDKNIIVTSIQKMSRYVKRKSFKELNQNILFIVDEAHRSTGTANDSQGMLKDIRKAIPTAAWVGYTGTPKFPETSEIFGNPLHIYTIKEAIQDHNVLGFKVEFKETIAAPEDPDEDDIDDNVRASVYDTSDEHVDLVVNDIFDNWKQRSGEGKYNALFTVHVGGNKASTPRAMQYFDKFAEINATKAPEDRLKVAVSFSADTSNGVHQLTTNENLFRAIQSYNKTFKTSWDMKSVKEYTNDVTQRLAKTADDGQFLDLVIVVDQLLTGFDAPELNTLYIDRTLKGGNLIQAYSRTNRIHNSVEKPYGNVVNYRWPQQNEYEMNKSFAIYSDRQSADQQLSIDELKKGNEDDGILAKPFSKALDETKAVIQRLADLTNDFVQTPPSEKDQAEAFDELKEYNHLISQLKQYTTDDDGNKVSAYDDAEDFYQKLGITKDQEIMLTTVIADELKSSQARIKHIDISDVELKMVHIDEVEINYDYLMEIIGKMADEVHNNHMEQAAKYRQDISVEVAKFDNDQQKNKINDFADKIYNKEFVFDKYPAPRDVEAMNDAIDRSQHDSNIKQITNFIRTWGIDNSISPKQLAEMLKRHRFGQKDVDNQGELTDLINAARTDYKEIAADEVAALSWIRYRRMFREAFYQMADEVVGRD